MTRAQKDKTISASLTLLIVGLTVLLCAFVGYKLPNPPIQEEGMGVSGEILGEIEGFGNNNMADFPNEAAPVPTASSSEENYTTASNTAPVAKNDRKDNNNVKNPSNNNTQSADAQADSKTNAEPSLNSNAMFPGKRNGTNSEGKGSAEGSGQKGSPDGTQGASGGTGSGVGIGYSLNGRSLRGTLPQPSYNSTKEGDVVVKIKVDRSGKVIEVSAPEKGSKNFDQSMLNAAKEAARKASFNPDPNATEYQTGTITYKFRKMG